MKKLKKRLEKVYVCDLKHADVILTVDHTGAESVEQINCIDNNVVWMEDIHGSDHPESTKTLNTYYDMYLLKRD